MNTGRQISQEQRNGQTVISVGPDAAEQDRRAKVQAARTPGASQVVNLDAILANQEAILAELRLRQ